MGEFRKLWENQFELRNIILMIYSIGALILIDPFISQVQNPNINIALKISSLFFLFVYLACTIDWIYQSRKRFTDFIFGVCISTFSMSIIIAYLLRDSNVMVACATIILVIVTGYSVMRTNEIARKQWKFQIDPIIALNVKENDTSVQIIDLIIENVGQGIAKNLQFDIHPHGFTTLSGDPIEKLFFFRQGLPILPSKQKYVIHLTNLEQKISEIKKKYNISDDHEWREKLKRELELTFFVKYEDIDGDVAIDEFKINLCVFWGLR